MASSVKDFLRTDGVKNWLCGRDCEWILIDWNTW